MIEFVTNIIFRKIKLYYLVQELVINIKTFEIGEIKCQLFPFLRNKNVKRPFDHSAPVLVFLHSYSE